MYRARILAAAAVLPSLLLAALGPTASAAPAARPNPGVPHCIAADGTDINALFHVNVRIIGPLACREAYANERWVRVVPSWTTAADAQSAVYPEGYKPSRPNPIDDFNSKFLSATYITDIGTAQEQRVTFKKNEVLRTGFVGTDGLPFTGILSPPLKGLPVGPHTSAVLVTLKAQHCDGLGTVVEENCLPAGTTEYSGPAPFTVVPRPA
ncbi:hypothetical protein [Streptomyces sp. NBC_01205]|uniref:hypothetical protein n=1 Tax=Streptomyces sp. NBC_01205 TaxID=2903771 RepID=UPI002E15BEF8|nr:hypothetical protein OG573_32400 [Streptomyces sp. NBC_01205]